MVYRRSTGSRRARVPPIHSQVRATSCCEEVLGHHADGFHLLDLRLGPRPSRPCLLRPSPGWQGQSDSLALARSVRHHSGREAVAGDADRGPRPLAVGPHHPTRAVGGRLPESLRVWPAGAHAHRCPGTGALDLRAAPPVGFTWCIRRSLRDRCNNEVLPGIHRFIGRGCNHVARPRVRRCSLPPPLGDRGSRPLRLWSAAVRGPSSLVRSSVHHQSRHLPPGARLPRRPAARAALADSGGMRVDDLQTTATHCSRTWAAIAPTP